MSSRREFFTTATASLASGAGASMASETTDRIDCQSPLFSEEFLRLLEKRSTSPYVYRKDGERYVVVGEWRRRLMPKHTDPSAKIADMDTNGIGKAAISINDPGPELFGKESPTMAVMLNVFIAATVKQHPDRFFGLAVLPFDSADSMLRELERATGKLGLTGILLYSNLDGRFPDEPEFQPLFAEAERKGVPLLLHPALPTTWQATRGYDMASMLGLMFDTTIALCRLILSGTLERHPDLKLVCPHVGGALPYLIGRVDHQTMVLKRGAQNIRRAPSDYLKRISFDTVSPIGLAIRYGYDFAGPDKMLYSSDHPWVDAGDHSRACQGIAPSQTGRGQAVCGERKEAVRSMRVSRRHFVLAAPATVAARSRSGLRLAICSETFQGMTFAEACKAASRCGYRGMEIEPAHLSADPTSLSSTERRQARRAMADAGLEYVGLHSFLKAPAGLHLTTADRDVRERSWVHFRRMIELVADLGDGAAMVLGSAKQRAASNGADVNVAKNRLRDGLARLARVAASRGATILLEPLAPHLCNVVTTLEEAIGMVKSINSPGLRSMLDTHNTAGEARPASELIRMWLPWIRHVHLNEMDGRRPGAGDFDFLSLLRQLKESRYGGWMSVEIFDFKPDGETVARQSAEFIRSLEQRLS